MNDGFLIIFDHEYTTTQFFFKIEWFVCPKKKCFSKKNKWRLLLRMIFFKAKPLLNLSAVLLHLIIFVLMECHVYCYI